MISEKAVKKYIAIRALAALGSPGEKGNAERAAARMEKDLPGIKKAAFAYENRERPSTAKRPDAAPSRPHHASASVGNWENIFSFAAGVYSGFAEAARTTAAAHYGREVAEDYVKVYTKESKYTEAVLITVKIPLSALHLIYEEFNEEQVQAFRALIHDRVEDELDLLINE